MEVGQLFYSNIIKMTIYEQDSTIYQGDLFNQKDSKY